MAFDKVVDSAQLDAAMTYTANRIRNKTGDTNQIAWDSAKGFGDAVDAITVTDRTYSLYPPRDESVDWTADTFEGIYFTCDSKALPVGHPKRMFKAKITLQNAGNVDYQVDLGVIENGTFVIKENVVDWRSGDYMKVVIPDYNTDFVVLRIIPLNGIQCALINADPQDVKSAFWVDRYGRMPYLTMWHPPGYSDYGGWTGLIRDSVITGERLDLNAAMFNMYSLREYTYPKFSTNLPSYANRGSRAFQNCSNLISLNMSKYATPVGVKLLEYMFSGCNSLTSLDISNFDTSAVTNMSYMFSGCNSLTSLDLSNFDTSAVTYMDGMFYDCYSLTSLDISNFNTSAVTNMSYMFLNCTALTDFVSCVFSRSIDFSTCAKLSHDSLMSIINNLAEVTNAQNLTLGTTNKTKLTINEIAIATEKGWTVA